jgi:hypothetical protein
VSRIFPRLETRRRRLRPVFFIGIFFVALPAFAHHSYAHFDSAHTRMLEGSIESVEWGNPHVQFKILVRSESGGKQQEWNIETHAPNILLRYGWTKNSLKYGERVRVVCNAMLDGSQSCRLHTVTFLDTGQTLETKLSVSLKSAPQ